MIIDPTTNRPFENPEETVIETPEIAKWNNTAQRKIFLENFGPSTPKEDLESFLKWIDMNQKIAAEGVELDVLLFEMVYKKLINIHLMAQKLLASNPTIEQYRAFANFLNTDLYEFFQEVKK